MKRQKRTIWYIPLLIFMLVGYARVSFSQDNCSQVLVDAENLYEDGKIEEIPEFVHPCMKSGFTKEEKVQAYKLLSMVYAFLDEDEKADEAVLNLLKLDKEYTINEELDPAEFIEVFETFRTDPIFRVGVKAGTNTNIFRIKETYEVPSNAENAGVYTPVSGFHGGISFDIPFKDKYEIVPELYYQSRSYNYSQFIPDLNGPSTFTETQSWLSLPVHFRYKYEKWKIIPYGDIGFSVNYLFISNLSSIETKNNASNSVVESPKQNWIESRKPLNFYASAGLGARYKVPMGYLIIESRYGFHVNSITKLGTELTPEQQLMLTKHQIRDNVFSMDLVTHHNVTT